VLKNKQCTPGHFFVRSSRELPYVLFKLHYMQIVYSSLISLTIVLRARYYKGEMKKINGAGVRFLILQLGSSFIHAHTETLFELTH
jgi:hypothetical protein